MVIFARFAFFLCLIPNRDEAAEKIVVVPVEEAILLPWHGKIPARLDKGAAISSFDVFS